MSNYIEVSMELMKLGLKPLELLVLAVIKSYTDDHKLCYHTNKQFAEMMNVTEKTVCDALDVLEEKNLIKRCTHTIKHGNGFTKRRTIVCVL